MSFKLLNRTPSPLSQSQTNNPSKYISLNRTISFISDSLFFSLFTPLPPSIISSRAGTTKKLLNRVPNALTFYQSDDTPSTNGSWDFLSNPFLSTTLTSSFTLIKSLGVIRKTGVLEINYTIRYNGSAPAPLEIRFTQAQPTRHFQYILPVNTSNPSNTETYTINMKFNVIPLNIINVFIRTTGPSITFNLQTKCDIALY
jgi:hypothetical protein